MKLCEIVVILSIFLLYFHDSQSFPNDTDDESDDVEDEGLRDFDELKEEDNPKYQDVKRHNGKEKYEEQEEIISLLKQYERRKRVHQLEKTENLFDTCNEARCIQELLKQFNQSCTLKTNKLVVAGWNYGVNMTPENAKKKTAMKLEFSKWHNKMIHQFRKIVARKIAGLSKKEERRLNDIVTTASSFNVAIEKKLSQTMNKMASIYSHAKVYYGGKSLGAGESAVVPFFAKVRNCTALTEVWKNWRDATGKKIRPHFKEMVRLLNIGAHANKYPDYGYYEWFTDFREPHFNEKVMDLYSKIAPLYKEIHAYVRYKLSFHYPDCIDKNGPIPAQLLGNVWAQQFSNIFDMVIPYKNVKSANVDETLKEQHWTVHKMYKAAETFFTSIGLFKMTNKFWKYSMLTQPKGRTVDCHGSATDFFTIDDFRIKMCTTLTRSDFKTIHHEMGHITYFMAYRNQPCLFRNGANSGFHEAIGDTIALSAGSNKHLKELKLMSNDKETPEGDINTLMQQALRKLVFLPFGLMIDTWRWRVFNGSITPETYNQEWWKLRLQLQGLIPPVARDESDFDPGSKYHVAHNVPYIRYFTSFIMQFQFYEAMCNASGHTGPLFKCDFYKSEEAGKLMKSMLSLGSSEPWSKAMKTMTGQSEIRLDSFMRYFDPLIQWMKNYRKQKGYKIGW